MRSIIYVAVYLCVAAVGLLSCKDKPSSVEQDDNTGPLFLSLESLPNEKGEEFLSSIASEIKYLPLETKEKSIISGIAKIALLNNGNILISSGSALNLFNPEGKHIRQVSQKGNGPADFLRISAIAVNPSTDGFFLQTNSKVIEFDKDGEYINSFPTEDRPMDMVIDTDGRILLHRMNVSKSIEDTTTTWFLFRYETSGKELRRFADISPRIKENGALPAVMPIRPLYLYNGKIRFNEILNDTIFTVEEDHLEPYAIIDLGNMQIPPTPPQKDISMVFEDIKSKLMLASLQEDDQFLYMTFGWGFSGEYVYSTYNKETGKIINYGNGGFYDTDCGLTNDLDGGLPFYPLAIDPDGTHIMWKNAEAFKEAVLKIDYETAKSRYGERFDKLRNLAQSLKDDDNPVLIFAK